MSVVSQNPAGLLLLAMLAVPASGSLAQQPQDLPEADQSVTVYGSPPPAAEMTRGPEIEGTPAPQLSS